MATPRYAKPASRYRLEVSKDGEGWLSVIMAQTTTWDQPAGTTSTERTIEDGIYTLTESGDNPTGEFELMDAPVMAVNYFIDNLGKDLFFRTTSLKGIDVTFAAPNTVSIPIPATTTEKGKAGLSVATFAAVAGAPDFARTYPYGLEIVVGAGGTTYDGTDGAYPIQEVNFDGANPVVYVTKRGDAPLVAANAVTNKAFKLQDPKRVSPVFSAKVLTAGGPSISQGSVVKRTVRIQLNGTEIPKEVPV